jgi:hypothetical protein
MAKTYEKIATNTLSTATSTITFTSIPATYTDLVVIASRKYSNLITGADNTFIRFNNDSTSVYSTIYLANPTVSGKISNDSRLYTSAGGNEINERFSADVWHIFNYSNTTTHKTSLLRMNFATSMLQNWVGLWRDTSAINRIDIIGGGTPGTFSSGSTFTLYGIKAA